MILSGWLRWQLFLERCPVLRYTYFASVFILNLATSLTHSLIRLPGIWHSVKWLAASKACSCLPAVQAFFLSHFRMSLFFDALSGRRMKLPTHLYVYLRIYWTMFLSTVRIHGVKHKLWSYLYSSCHYFTLNVPWVMGQFGDWTKRLVRVDLIVVASGNVLLFRRYRFEEGEGSPVWINACKKSGVP